MKLHNITITCEYKNIKNLIDYFLKHNIYWHKKSRFIGEDRFDYWLDPKHFVKCGFNIYFENGVITGWDYSQHLAHNFKIISFERLIREEKLKKILNEI